MSTRHRIVTLVLLSSSTTALARPHHPHRAPAAPASAAAQLRQIRTELAEFIDPEALPRFQALTDADGYPYVGNVKTKGSRHQDNEMDDDMDVVRKPPSSRLTTGFVARVFHVNGRGERIDL